MILPGLNTVGKVPQNNETDSRISKNFRLNCAVTSLKKEAFQMFKFRSIKIPEEASNFPLPQTESNWRVVPGSSEQSAETKWLAARHFPRNCRFRRLHRTTNYSIFADLQSTLHCQTFMERSISGIQPT